MNKKRIIQKCLVAMIFWLALSFILFAFGYIFPPHAPSNNEHRLLGGAFWSCLTIINGFFYYMINNLIDSIQAKVVLSAFISSLVIGMVIYFSNIVLMKTPKESGENVGCCKVLRFFKKVIAMLRGFGVDNKIEK